jgi:hypothetical protein
MDRIDFEYAIDILIIFLLCILKFVKGMFRMECDQRVIIKFLLNRETNTRDIADRLQVQFDEHVYKLQIVQFWITETWIDRQNLHDEIRTGRFPLDDLDAKILTILNKSPFESTRSIAKTLCVAHSIVLLHLHIYMTLLASDRSICIWFRIC